jgi:5'-3' exonuclease
MPAPLLAVDGPSLLYRSFFALPDSIKDGAGQPANALLGFTNATLRICLDEGPRAVVICWGREAARYRKRAYPPYHADRPPVPDALAAQWAGIEEWLAAFGWPSVTSADLEADDLLHAFSRAEEAAGGTCLLLTGDRDMFQSATDRTAVLYLKTGVKGFERYGPAEVEERYGIPPALVPDFIALRGDPSDGLPGAKGIGEKGAADLLRRHGSLEAAIAGCLRESPRVRAALHDHAEEVLMFKDVATLRTPEVELPPDAPTDVARGAAAARERGLDALAKRLEGGPS